MEFGKFKPLSAVLPCTGTGNARVCTMGAGLIFVKTPLTRAFAGKYDAETDRAVAGVRSGGGRTSAISRRRLAALKPCQPRPVLFHLSPCLHCGPSGIAANVTARLTATIRATLPAGMKMD